MIPQINTVFIICKCSLEEYASPNSLKPEPLAYNLLLSEKDTIFTIFSYKKSKKENIFFLKKKTFFFYHIYSDVDLITVKKDIFFYHIYSDVDPIVV